MSENLNLKNSYGLALLLGTLGPRAVMAQATEDKSQYHLFNPAPQKQMRELSTDRPDKTESPYTVDAGHFQIEMDLVTYSYDKYSSGRDVRVESFRFVNTNLKVGLLNNVDLQLVVPTDNTMRTHDRMAGSLQTDSGFGDLTTRLKVNLWGNDSGKTAFGIMPFLKAPTASDGLGNNSVEGGIIFPLSVKLPTGWQMGVMIEFDFNRNEANTGHHVEFISSITFSHDIYKKLGGYMEFFSAVSAERDSQWVGTFDLGLTYALTENIQLDAGTNFGISRAADDINPFVGLSFRF